MAASVRIRITKVLFTNKVDLGICVDPFWLLIPLNSYPYIRDVERKIVSVCLETLLSQVHSQSDTRRLANEGGQSSVVSVVDFDHVEDEDDKEFKLKSILSACQLWLDGCRLLQSERTEVLRDNDSITVHISENVCRTHSSFLYGLNDGDTSTPDTVQSRRSQDSQRADRYTSSNKTTIDTPRKRRRSDNGLERNTVLSIKPSTSCEDEDDSAKPVVKKSKENDCKGSEQNLILCVEAKDDGENVCDTKQKKKKKKKDKGDKDKKKKKKTIDVSDDSAVVSSKSCHVEENVDEDEPEIALEVLIANKMKELKEKECRKKTKKDTQLDRSESDTMETTTQGESHLSAEASGQLLDGLDIGAGIVLERKKRRRRKPKNKRKVEEEAPKVLRVVDKPRSSVLNLPWDQQPQNTKVVFDSDSSDEEAMETGENTEVQHVNTNWKKGGKLDQSYGLKLDNSNYNNSLIRQKNSSPENEKKTDTSCVKQDPVGISVDSVSASRLSKINVDHVTNDAGSSKNINAEMKAQSCIQIKPAPWTTSNKYLRRSTGAVLDLLRSAEVKKSPSKSTKSHHKTNSNTENKKSTRQIPDCNGATFIKEPPTRLLLPTSKTAVEAEHNVVPVPSVVSPKRCESDKLSGKREEEEKEDGQKSSNTTTKTSLQPKKHESQSNVSPKPKSKVSPRIQTVSHSHPQSGGEGGGACLDTESKFQELLRRRKLSGASCNVRTTPNGVSVWSRTVAAVGPKCRRLPPMDGFADPARDVLTNKSTVKTCSSPALRNGGTIASKLLQIAAMPVPTTTIVAVGSNASSVGTRCLLEKKDKVEVIPLDPEGCPSLTGPPTVGDILGYKVLEMSEDYQPVVSDFKTGKVLSCEADGCLLLQTFGTTVTKKRTGKFELVYEDSEDEIEDTKDSGQEEEQVSVYLHSMMDTRLVQREAGV